MGLDSLDLPEPAKAPQSVGGGRASPKPSVSVADAPSLGASMFDATGDGVLVVTQSDHIVRYANFAAQRMFRDALVGNEFGTPTDGSEVDLVGSGGRVAELRVSEIEQNGIAAWLVILRDVSERNQALREAHADRDRAREQAERRTILLREVDHRVVNTFQMLSSLVQLRRRATGNLALATELDQIRERINAVGRSLHALNRTGTNETIALDRFLTEILADLVGLDASAELRMELTATEITASRAQHIGLIVHELVRNAIKYAYPGDRTGKVLVSSEQSDAQELRIVVLDTGAGFEPDAVPEGGGLGSELNSTLARMLGGALTITSGAGGTRCELRVPVAHEDA